MSNRPTEFLTKGPKAESLAAGIRKLSDASAGFSRAWLEGRFDDARKTSEEGIALLDHILNQILGHRDARRTSSTWSVSPFKVSLNAQVGDVVESPSAVQLKAFLGLPIGKGELPAGIKSGVLGLEMSLNKIKHRDRNRDNFSVSAGGDHFFVIHTPAAQGKTDTLAKIDINKFCNACRDAEKVI